MTRSPLIRLACGLLAVCVWQAAAQNTPVLKNPPKAPQGWVLVQEDAWSIFDDEPEHEFETAHDAFRDHDLDAAAVAIRKGAVFMQVEASRDTDKGKQALMEPVHELNQLADAVQNGHVTSLNQLNQAFGRAQYAMAKHHYRMAADAWQTKGASANRDFKAAAQDLKWGVKWTGQKASASTRQAISDADSLGEKIKSGGKWAAQHMGEGLKNLGKAIEDAANQVENPQ